MLSVVGWSTVEATYGRLLQCSLDQRSALRPQGSVDHVGTDLQTDPAPWRACGVVGGCPVCFAFFVQLVSELSEPSHHLIVHKPR
jgi:hypothetical protein